jgi:hypothetical protein
VIRPEQLETPVEIVEAIFRRVGARTTRETSSLMRNAMFYHCQTNVRIQQPLPDSGLSAYGRGCVKTSARFHTVVFTSAFESVKKQIEGVQKTAHT